MLPPRKGLQKEESFKLSSCKGGVTPSFLLTARQPGGKAKMSTAIIVESSQSDHLPDWGEYLDLAGLTLRQALAAIRAAGRKNFGNIGGMTAELSDGSSIEVSLRPAGDRTYVMSSQRIVRRRADEIVREYKW